MTDRFPRIELLARQEVVPAPVLPSEGCRDRTFELPTALYAGVWGLLFAYLIVMTVGFASDGMVLPMAINFIFVAAFAVVPGLWATMKPAKESRALDWLRFQAQGIQTQTGRTSAGEAATLVLLLPACILFWGLAVTTIAALV